ncbi:MAG: hypothetical protein ABI039_05460 [Vicinamibacterales bacterium]
MWLSTIVALLVVTQSASIPDFSGRWRMIPERSGSPTQSQPVSEMIFVIEQNTDQIHLDMTSGTEPTVSATYVLGPMPKPPAEPIGTGQRAYWDGNRLVVERGGTISGQTVSSKQTLSLSPDQSELIVERLVIVQHGYTLKGTPNYASVKDVFTRMR